MSDQRGRGAPRGGRGGHRGDYNASRGDSSRGRGHRGRGEFRGGSSSGGPREERGGFRGGRGGSSGRGDHQQLAYRAGPVSDEHAAGIYLENAPVPAPDKTVIVAEDARVKETRNKIIDGYPGRPGHGTQGKPIVLRANYFPLTTAYEAKKPEVVWHRYAVIPAEAPSKAKLRRLIEMIAGMDIFRGVTWATDFSAMIVTTQKLDLGTSGRYRGKIELTDPNDVAFQPPQETDSPQVRNARSRRTQEFKMEYTNSFTLRQLVESLRANAPASYFSAKGDIIQMCNIVIAKYPNITPNVYSFSQNKFYPDQHALMQQYPLGGGLRAVRGYYASVRTSTHRILLNLNVSSAAFYSPIPLRDLMNESLGDNHVPRQQSDLEKLEGFLRLVRVETRYLKSVDKTGKPTTIRKAKTIMGFARRPRFGNAKEVKFSFASDSQAAAREVSVFDYFKSKHGVTLSHWNEPVLNIGSIIEPVYLPVELAFVMPGQAVKRLLVGPQTAEMIKVAARAPNLNAMSIAGTSTDPGKALVLMGLRAEEQANTVQPFGFSVATEMVTVPGRILVSPQLQYGTGAPITPRFGSWNVADTKFVVPGTFKSWSCLVLNYQGPRGQALESQNLVSRQGDTMLAPDPLVDEFERHLGSYGLKMGKRLPSQHITIPAPMFQNRGSIDAGLDERFKRAASAGLDILLAVLREADKWLYARIKYYGDIKYGVQTVNVVGNKFQKPRGQGMYFGNVALKFNIKGGGVAHTIPEKSMSPLDQQTMLVGIDVTHPSPGSSEGSPSIAGVVANIDSKLCQWPGSLRSQTGRQEMVEGLAAMMLERLDLWRKKNRTLPNKIIIYRDGVSEGQYRLVLETELPAVQEAFKQRYGDQPKWPKVTIVVVGKRHHTRFYPTRREDADQRSFNPLPGTVVDRGVTDHFLWDFYLQAHQGLQGTARPAHYVVIMDQIKFEQDQLEAFTHKLCYLFNRATKAVSICPPAYYADLICERGRAYLYSTVNENQTSGGSAYDANTAEWTSGVHAKLQEKTFYV